MDRRNVLLTGLPRSGTTLVCQLLNTLPETVALHEPLRVARLASLADRGEVLRRVKRFLKRSRASLLQRGTAVSRNVAGRIPDNTFGDVRAEWGLRRSSGTRGEIVIDKPLSPAFLLCVKHHDLFTAALEDLTGLFPCFAVIRNPLAVLASWNSVQLFVYDGRLPAAERLDNDLATALSQIDDRLERQIHLLGWFYGTYQRLLPEQALLRYEDIIESGGSRLSVITPHARALRKPLQTKNRNELYDFELMRALGERLLARGGPFWDLYTRASVASLMES